MWRTIVLFVIIAMVYLAGIWAAFSSALEPKGLIGTAAIVWPVIVFAIWAGIAYLIARKQDAREVALGQGRYSSSAQDHTIR